MMPVLVVAIPLEDAPRVAIVAASYEDELRLRTWLRRARVVERAEIALGALLDELEDREAA